MALADVYDALISKRVYKPPFSHDKALAIIEEGRGQHFDPIIVDAFLRVEDKFKQIAKELADEDAPEKAQTMVSRSAAG
ncbi:two-component response regulator [Vibrio mimicus CAIM 602]|nr:two-component response regulator [Vibrio mimicus CAIM 602]